MFIKSLGHQMVGYCKTGREAVSACHELRPDVVLMDINIEGDLDGISTCQLIYEEFDIPVVYVSGETDNHIIQNAVTSNSYGYLVKPITKQELGISIDLAYYKHKVDIESRASHVVDSQFLTEVSSAVVVVSQGKIRYLNKLAMGLFKASDLEEMIVKPFVDFVGSDLRMELSELIDKPFVNSRWSASYHGTLLDVEGRPFVADITVSEVAFGGSRVFQFVINDKSRDIEPVTYITVMKKALMNYPRLCLLLSQDLEVYSFSPIYSDYPKDVQSEIERFLNQLNLNNQFEEKDELKVEMQLSIGSIWIKIFVARDVSHTPMEYIVIEVDKE